MPKNLTGSIICLPQDQPLDVLKSLHISLPTNYVDSAEGFLYANTAALRNDNLLKECHKQY